jgi:hypothetical protein
VQLQEAAFPTGLSHVLIKWESKRKQLFGQSTLMKKILCFHYKSTHDIFFANTNVTNFTELWFHCCVNYPCPYREFFHILVPYINKSYLFDTYWDFGKKGHFFYRSQ